MLAAPQHMRRSGRRFLRAKPGYTPQAWYLCVPFPSARTMPIHVAAQRQIFVGQPVTIEGVAPQGQFSAVFEDDGETGYFYALDRALASQPIQDAVHIYDVQSVTDRAQPSTVKIGWAADCRKAVLLINDYPHAVFDFEAQQGYCRSGFPPPGVGPWSQDGHVWDEACIALFA